MFLKPHDANATKIESTKKATAKAAPVRRLTQTEKHKANVDRIFDVLFNESPAHELVLNDLLRVDVNFIQHLLEVSRSSTLNERIQSAVFGIRKALITVKLQANDKCKCTRERS
jgi:hypothetical protein